MATLRDEHAIKISHCFLSHVYTKRIPFWRYNRVFPSVRSMYTYIIMQPAGLLSCIRVVVNIYMGVDELSWLGSDIRPRHNSFAQSQPHRMLLNAAVNGGCLRIPSFQHLQPQTAYISCCTKITFFSYVQSALIAIRFVSDWCTSVMRKPRFSVPRK